MERMYIRRCIPDPTNLLEVLQRIKDLQWVLPFDWNLDWNVLYITPSMMPFIGVDFKGYYDVYTLRDSLYYREIGIRVKYKETPMGWVIRVEPSDTFSGPSLRLDFWDGILGYPTGNPVLEELMKRAGFNELIKTLDKKTYTL